LAPKEGTNTHSINAMMANSTPRMATITLTKMVAGAWEDSANELDSIACFEFAGNCTSAAHSMTHKSEV
jgi:hypothetical protein